MYDLLIVAELISKNSFCRPKSPMKKLQSCKRHILIILGFILGFILQQTGISFQCFVLHRHAALRARGRVVCETSARNPQRPWQKYRVSLRSWRHLGLRSNPFHIPVDSEDLNGFGTLNHLQFEIWIDSDRLVRKSMSFVGSTWLWCRS